VIINDLIDIVWFLWKYVLFFAEASQAEGAEKFVLAFPWAHY